ncbi:P4 alpha zinc-binding domain protein [Planctopirus limnophila DSM 3776]|uniref:P4 alpha zinc-binding domain protein n=1 Tax=Planctopirus limnophila (strain ATCC 43296 / DSM 3776 / IFAM 1008 / Mu 290) TaxID=521674 RepID=D5ST64_PLAL2|nr:DUF3987 domain-containing protein [Planctopirus limnophila]ADG66832.1 P4 alpha zinc-binding domain protein [Planctopirus limnophila DSM 3776]
MNHPSQSLDANEIKAAARGQWEMILSTVGGIDSALLDGKHHPCPKCGGTDRFRMLDADAGSLYCNQCFNERNGDGLAAVQWLRGCDFPEALRLVADELRLNTGQPSAKREPISRPVKPMAEPPDFDSKVERFDNPEALFDEYLAAVGPATLQSLRDAAACSVWWPATGNHRQRCLLLPATLPGGQRPVGVILRRVDGKPFPAIPNGLPERKTHTVGGSRDGWVVIGGWQRFAEARIVWKCEGVPDALALAKHLPAGHIAFTNICGCKPIPDELPDFGGKELRVIGDSDEPGQTGARKFAERVATVQQTATIKLLPALHEVTPTHGLDLRDFFKEGGTLEGLEALAANAEQIEPAGNEISNGAGTFVDNKSLLIEPFREFPVEALPHPVRGFVLTAAAALGCDPSFIALPLLVACAAAIGNTRRLQMRRGWTEPAILWGIIVGFSGEAKTPALEIALRAIKERQRTAVREWQSLMRDYEAQLPAYRRDLKDFEKGKLKEAPVEPVEPACKQLLTSDATIEALAGLLVDQPRGMLVAVDELAGWFASHERYSSGDSSAPWLELFGGHSLTINRKTGQKRLYIPNASVSIIGGIQPFTLKQHLTSKHRASGMAARFLMTMPPRRKLEWTECEIPDELFDAMKGLFNRLLALEPEPPEGEFDEPRAKLLRFDAAAKSRFIQFHDLHASEQRELDSELAASWSKLRAYAGRLAIVIHGIRWANGEIAPERELIVDAETVDAAVRLVEWFGNETRRVYATLRETEGQAEMRDFLDWLVQRGGEITPRELVQSRRQFKDVSEARTYLSGLEALGYGSWREACSGGRPKRTFVLSPQYQRNTFVDNESLNAFPISLGDRFIDENELAAIHADFD